MRAGLLVLFLSLSGCASYYSKSTLSDNYNASYRFGCLDVMWEQKNFCKAEDPKCMDEIQKICDRYEERFKVFLLQHDCFYNNEKHCFRE